MSPFPKDFIWGAATSAYQVEGSPLADGAGPSNWHRFTHAPDSRIPGRENGDVACDHYRRWREDVALMKDLGLKAYRFSLSWSRILPEGTGRLNGPGLDFYQRLVEALLEAGIQPYPTLYHWDLPEALEARGGWLNRDVAHWFADYAQAVVQTLGDRVTHWTTLNEPWVVAHDGHVTGAHAPGHMDIREVPRVAHNLLRAHGLGARAIRAAGGRSVGLVVNIEPKHPASPDPLDGAAAVRADAYMNRQFLDPAVLGRHPEALPGLFGDAWPATAEADLRDMQAPLDFLGVNYYTRSVTAHDPEVAFGQWRGVPQVGAPHTQMGWEIHPQGLEEVLCWLHERYGLPVLVTENGAALDDPPPQGGRIRDEGRMAYLRSHLEAVARAREAGADVRGYFAWSLFDNFEWAFGYARTFGLVALEPGTLRRMPKDSALLYRDLIRAGGEMDPAG